MLAPRRAALLVVAGIVAAVFAAYGPVLDSFFFEIDDSLHLAGVRAGEYPSPHFRPLHFVWNRALFALFGTAPFPYYLVGLLLHAASALLVALLVQRLVRDGLQAAVAGLVFAVFFAPHEAVLWFSASCVLLVGFFLLATSVVWTKQTDAGGVGRYAAAILLGMLAMASKEDCVVLAPLLIGIHVLRRGGRSLVQRATLARFAPFAVLGAAYLLVAVRPNRWEEMPNVGQYELRLALVPKLVENFAWLFWPRTLHVDALPAWGLPAGAVALPLLALLGWRLRTRAPLAAFGLVLAVAGLLPVLPGPHAAIADRRYAYAATIGVALLAAALFRVAWDASARGGRPARVVLAAGLALWIGVQVVAIRSVEAWRFAPKCERLQRLVVTTRAAVLAPLESGVHEQAFVVAPDTWNPRDYLAAVRVFLDVAPDRLELSPAPLDELLVDLAPGGRLDPREHAVFTSWGDARIQRVASPDELPTDSWERLAGLAERRGRGRVLAVVRIRATPRSGT